MRNTIKNIRTKHTSFARGVTSVFLQKTFLKLVFCICLLFIGLPQAHAAVVSWDGGGTDGTCGGAGTANNWSCAINWNTDVAPTASDIATFDATSTKNATINANISVAGINIIAGYTATITQSSTYTITVGTSNWVQAEGTFTGGSGAITINGSFTLSGGTFTSTTGTLTINLNFTHTAGGTFNHNNGSVKMTAACGGAQTRNLDVATSETFNNFEKADPCDSGSVVVASGDTIIVLGTFTHSGGYIDTGIIEVRGNVSVSNAGGGSASINFTGTNNQTITSSSNTASLNINKPSGTVTVTGNLGVINFTLTSGTFTSTTGTLTVGGAWTHTAGGTFNHNNGTVLMSDDFHVFNCGATHILDVATSETFYNFKKDEPCSGGTLTIASGDTIIVLGTFTHTNGTLNTGTLEVQGNVSVGAAADGGTAPLSFTGSNDQIYTDNGGNELDGDTTINKSSGVVTLASNADWNASGQDLTITAGAFNQNSFNLSTRNISISTSSTWFNSSSTAASSNLTISGNFTNNGTFIATSTGTTTFTSASSQAISGTTTTNTTFNNLVMSGAGTKTLSTTATTSNFVINASSRVTMSASSSLFISGNYQNSGTFIAGTGTTTLNGTATQTLSGTMTGTSTFANLHITNTSGLGSTTQSVIFANSASTTDTLTMNASTSAQFLASATSTFQNISLNGASGQPVYLRSSSPNTQYNFSVPGTQKLVTYVDVRDSNACPTTITTATNTSNNSGNNTCWTFSESTRISSANNQTFTYAQATTSISTITITDASTPTITSTNDLRIVIATTSANMRFDTTDTTATVGGSASAKVSGTVSYLGNGEILLIDVTGDFSAGDTLTISDLSFAQFSSANAPISALGVRTAGVGTTTVSSDDKTVAISGALTLANHTSGQVSDNFTSNTQSSTTLFAFNLTPAGESASISSLVFSLQGIYGVQTGDLTNVTLYRDMNSDRAYDAGDIAVGGSGVVSISGQSGTITFSTTISATTTQNYILVSDIANLSGIDGVTIALTSTNITTTGVTTALVITETGSITTAQHVRVSRGGGGAIGSAAPAGQGVTTGGGQGGGSIIDPNTGDTIGNEIGFNAPSTHGTPLGAWTSGGNAYSSNGTYATTSGTGAQHSYGTFGFMVPSNNTITGIAVKLEASASTADGTISVKLSWDGGSSVTALSTTGTLTTTDAVYTLGGPSDTWGRSWTPAELDNGNFTIEVIGNPNSNTIQLDAIQVRVYHQATGGGGGGGGAVFKEPQRFFASVSTAFEPVREVLKDTLYTMLRWLFA